MFKHRQITSRLQFARLWQSTPQRFAAAVAGMGNPGALLAIDAYDLSNRPIEPAGCETQEAVRIR
ncbi:MAG TPA: hypothetical protein VFH80_08550 [Solirubrobacteraceae bacterium]|nr:hypothetical protein [Solirubrobacteraceae bacterium]